MATNLVDPRAPMAAAPIKYRPDGSVDWGNMWDSFCALAREGGPPHRPTLLLAQEDSRPDSEGYRFAAAEISRAVEAVSGLAAAPAETGWVAVRCQSAAMARWLQESIEQEGVQARSVGALLLVPAGERFTLKGEIKSVVTAVAKTTHYWVEHLPLEVKHTLEWQERLGRLRGFLARWLGA